MFSIYIDQIVRQEQQADLNRRYRHNQLVRDAMAARAARHTDLAMASNKIVARLAHNFLSVIFNLV